jgi:sugar lactone lactonase YvrE
MTVPMGLAVDPAGNIYLADAGNARIRRVARDGTMTTVAGQGNRYPNEIPPQGPDDLQSVVDLAVGGGVLYVADPRGGAVHRFGLDGSPRGALRLADVGPCSGVSGGFWPQNLEVDAAGDLYVENHDGHCVLRVRPDGTVARIAGNGRQSNRGIGEGPEPDGPATEQSLNLTGMTATPDGTVWVVDTGVLRRIGADGRITSVEPPWPGAHSPQQVRSDSRGQLWIVAGHQLLRFDPARNTAGLVAGKPAPGFSGDGGVASDAALDGPYDVVLRPNGDAVVADRWNLRLRLLAAH